MAREKRTRGRCLCVFSSILYCSHIVYLAACGLSWFFPPLWVFHIISCVLKSTLFSEFYFVHTFSVLVVAERTWKRILTSSPSDTCGGKAARGDPQLMGSLRRGALAEIRRTTEKLEPARLQPMGIVGQNSPRSRSLGDALLGSWSGNKD